jgi:hypothetical protein
MKEVRGLIYFAGVSRSVPSIRGFKRCPEHGNVLAYDGRPLPMAEFNKVADKTLGEQAKGIYGLIPVVRLVEVEVADVVPVETAPPQPAKPAKPLSPTIRVAVEPIDGGFMLVDYEADPVRYMGQSLLWELEAGLVLPFATEQEARQHAPGPIVAASAISQTAAEADKPDDSLVGEDSGASSPLVEKEASAPSGPESSLTNDKTASDEAAQDAPGSPEIEAPKAKKASKAKKPKPDAE